MSRSWEHAGLLRRVNVITGSCKGRRLVTVAGLSTRPTSGVLKGALFNILGERVYQEQVLDICAGIGSLGIEALSRGAAHVTFIEENREAVQAIRRNINNCKFTKQSQVMQGDVLRLLPEWRPLVPIGLVFCDPPYNCSLAVAVLELLGVTPWLQKHALVVVEHHRNLALPQQVGSLECYRTTGHSLSKLSFYSQGGG